MVTVCFLFFGVVCGHDTEDPDTLSSADWSDWTRCNRRYVVMCPELHNMFLENFIEAFESWRSVYGKEYSPEEYQQRLNNFKQNGIVSLLLTFRWTYCTVLEIVEFNNLHGGYEVGLDPPPSYHRREVPIEVPVSKCFSSWSTFWKRKPVYWSFSVCEFLQRYEFTRVYKFFYWFARTWSRRNNTSSWSNCRFLPSSIELLDSTEGAAAAGLGTAAIAGIAVAAAVGVAAVGGVAYGTVKYVKRKKGTQMEQEKPIFPPDWKVNRLGVDVFNFSRKKITSLTARSPPRSADG